MSKCITSEMVTAGVRVRAVPSFIAENSRPEEDKYFFSYTISVTNETDSPVQLLSRHWIIINSEGDREEVTGPGVVGKTPLIEPGETFQYTSFCPLNTEWGTMEGSYRMIDQNGSEFDVQIERFVLVSDQV